MKKEDDIIIDPEWEVDRKEREKEIMRRAARELAELRGEGGTSEPEPEAPEDAFAEKPTPSRLKQYLAGMLSGSILGREEVSRSYKYLIGIALLMMFYIYNVFYMQHLYRRQEHLTEQVRELRAQAMTLSSMRMNATRQSAVERELEARGSQVRISMTPPKVVEK